MNEEWINVAALADVPEDDVIGLVANGRDVALYKVEGEVFATDNLCTHGNARLSDGFLEDGQIECPLHQGRFCVKSGEALCAPLTENIRVYPVRIEGERILLNLV
ncbi:non-heme iron oxygenase ferredoxin subunit [Pseudomonas sp. P115]|uniref:non-heme iron oxygenase ferredoxin subunit n=1 Tax=Pseudomonas pisciculturae TaxID=2730413 RepID=UPI0018921FBF|nr:non-heme iron oxygenase ferredoxin subunit [Pseudomonas pisciculturae]MBF6029798.1 non-heme iron oxygenase ferredoxin subunit [Pseudomonas pisciculturae]